MVWPLAAGQLALSPEATARYVAVGSSTSFQAQAAHRFSPDSGHIAASHRSATKSADARQGAADDGELRKLPELLRRSPPISEA